MTFAFWCRCTPCPMFSTPNIPFSNKSSCTTRIANNTLVCVRFMLKASYFCVAYFRRVLTHRSCKKYNHFRMLRCRKNHVPSKKLRCACAIGNLTFTNRVASTPAFIHAVSGCMAHKHEPECQEMGRRVHLKTTSSK